MHWEDPADGWEILRRIWRRKLLVGMVTAGVLVSGAVAAALLTPRYQAETRILLGIQEPKIADIQAVIEGVTPNDETINSEAYVISSRGIARQVGYRLALDKSPLFNPALAPAPDWKDMLAPGYVVGEIKNALRSIADALGLAADSETDATTVPDAEARTEALWQTIEGRLLNRLKVEPLNRSHVLSITAESEDQALAASIANAFADVYVEQTLVDKRRAADLANEWLETRIADLREKVIESERAVESYRRENELFASRSDTLVGQQLAVLNQELMTSESEKTKTRSSLEQARSAAKKGAGLDNIPTVLQSPLIVQLRGKQADLEREAANLSATYTDAHPKIRNIKAQIADIERKISAEINRIVDSLENQYRIASDRHDRVIGRMDNLKSRLGESNAEEVTLRQLEREADANRTLLENLLQRSKETAQPPGLSGSSAEVISAAVVPQQPSFPPTNLILVVSAIAGIGIGILIALLIERMDQTFRTSEEIEEHTGLPTLAVLPQIKQRSLGRLDYVLRKPNSTYTNALRMLGAQLSFEGADGKLPKLVMFTSALPGESKSHTSCSFAQLMAREGHRVILLDLDWRQPTQHRNFGRRRSAGVIELLNGDASVEDVILTDKQSGVDFLLAGSPDQMQDPNVSLQHLGQLFKTLSRHYDLIVLDTPPLRIAPELLYLAQLVQRVVLMVRWGNTPRSAVTAELRNLLRAGANVAGIVLTQVNPDRYGQYSYNDGGYLRHGYLVHESA
jgi:capsular exopolysaccharide synthesis family protein